MVTNFERRLCMAACRLKIWRVKIGLFRTTEIYARWGTRWLYNWIKARQIVDDLHHAPCCPANHWHKQRLVFQPCNCGAAQSTGGAKP